MLDKSAFMQIIYDTISYVFPENCFEELLISVNFLHPKCLRLVTSRALGLMIIAGSFLVKLPQILKIYHARSGAGVSLLSNFLELFCLTATVAYSYVSRFNFSAWGDSLTVALQTCVIASLILWYRGNKFAWLFFVGYIALTAASCSGLFSVSLLALLQSFNIPVVVIAKAVQVVENFKNRSTGQLSPITVLLQFAGCAARIFTSVQETGDALLIYTYTIATLMNGLIFAQILIYWGRKITIKMD